MAAAHSRDLFLLASHVAQNNGPNKADEAGKFGRPGARLGALNHRRPNSNPTPSSQCDGSFLYNESREFNKTSTQESHKHQILVVKFCSNFEH
jgi:hypothetical protein